MSLETRVELLEKLFGTGEKLPCAVCIELDDGPDKLWYDDGTPYQTCESGLDSVRQHPNAPIKLIAGVSIRHLGVSDEGDKPLNTNQPNAS
jgi:hypothetical protein